MLEPVSRKSGNFSGAFSLTLFSLYLQNKGISRQETLQLFKFLFPLQHMKKPATQNKRGRSFTNGFSGPKSFRDFPETDLWTPLLAQFLNFLN